MMKAHFTELAIVTAVECLNEVYYDKIICNILISNLNLIDQHNIKISSALKEKLSNFLSNYLKNFNTFVELEAEDFAQILNLISSLLEFQDLASKCSTIEIILPSLQASCSKILPPVNVDNSNELEKLINFFRIIETLLKSISKLERNSKIYCVLIALEDLLSEAFLIRNQSVLVYSFSLLSAYYEVVDCHGLIQKIWSNAVNNVSKDRSYSEFYLIMISYLIGSSFGKKEMSEIMNNDEFWTALQLCLEDEQCVQKHAMHVLKYAVFNLCCDDSCKPRNSSVSKCAHIEDHNSWWKTYFIIMENLDEKQTHLVLPVFSHLNNLINDENVVADTFWILRLLESGLKHDSRTVRIEALLFLLNVNVSSLNKRHIPYIVKIILTALNDSSLFRKAFKTNKFEDLKQKFIDWIANLSSQEYFRFFFEIFYKTIIKLKWSPVPFFYTLKAITECESFECLDSSLIAISSDAISSITRFHNIKIRAAIQCLFIKFLVMYGTKKDGTVLVLLELLNNFNEHECLLRNVITWRMIAEYLQQSTDYEFFGSYLSTRVSAKVNCDESLTDSTAYSLARMIVLFEDAFPLKKYPTEFSTWINSFENASHKPYLNRKVQNNRLKLIVNLLKIERSGNNTRCCQSDPMYFHTAAKMNFIHLSTYVIESMLVCENFEIIDFYENSLKELSLSFDEDFTTSMKANMLVNWLTKACNGLKHEKEYFRYASLKFISWIYHVIYRHPKLQNASKSRNIIFSTMVDYITHYEERSLKTERFISNESVQISGKIYSNFTNDFWSTMEMLLYFENSNALNRIEIATLFDIILESLDLARKENLINIFKTLKMLFRIEGVLKYEAVVLKIIRISWKLVEETFSTPYYLDSLKYWIQSFYQKVLMGSRIYQQEFKEHINNLLKKVAEDGGQSYYGMILVITELEKISNIFHVFSGVTRILINIFCVTHINRKDQRIEYETIEYISGLGDSISVNQLMKYDSADSAEEMRLMALNVLLKLYDEEYGIEKCTEVMKLLTSSDDLSKKRYFNDSAFHRIKHKKLQLLLIFETILYKKLSSSEKSECPKELFNFSVNSLLTEPHQPSVRYMLEWLLVRLIVHFPDALESNFWNCFSEASEERVGSICSFISVAFHLANVVKKEKVIETAIKSILPWTMAQHFNARLYAQTVLVKLIEMNSSIVKKYEIIRHSLENSLKTGNAVKNAVKLQQDFYFSYFHATDHFSLETILWELPRLSNICQEEWIQVRSCKTRQLKEFDSIPILSKNENRFSDFISSSWIAKATSVANIDEKYSFIEQEQTANALQESQKKFIPQSSPLTPTCSPDTKKSDNLIVVASLIDRAPNLGGLTRTCEIFAVSMLVVNNLEIIRNKEYTSLSITAEKHIQMSEVKRYYLFSYLKNKKEEGYSIIGAEQTTNSRSLDEFEFPKKSILVLGNEKEGIPANLLPLLDVCVEIPQKGVIRSLNVHVSGSLFIWEYAKQHLFNQ